MSQHVMPPSPIGVVYCWSTLSHTISCPGALQCIMSQHIPPSSINIVFYSSPTVSHVGERLNAQYTDLPSLIVLHNTNSLLTPSAAEAPPNPLSYAATISELPHRSLHHAALPPPKAPLWSIRYAAPSSHKLHFFIREPHFVLRPP